MLGVASLAGLVMLVLAAAACRVPEGEQARARRSCSSRCCRVVIAVVLAEVTEGGLDPRVLAILGVLSACNAVLRGLVGRHRPAWSWCSSC